MSRVMLLHPHPSRHQLPRARPHQHMERAVWKGLTSREVAARKPCSVGCAVMVEWCAALRSRLPCPEPPIAGCQAATFLLVARPFNGEAGIHLLARRQTLLCLGSMERNVWQGSLAREKESARWDIHPAYMPGWKRRLCMRALCSKRKGCSCCTACRLGLNEFFCVREESS